MGVNDAAVAHAAAAAAAVPAVDPTTGIVNVNNWVTQVQVPHNDNAVAAVPHLQPAHNVNGHVMPVVDINVVGQEAVATHASGMVVMDDAMNGAAAAAAVAATADAGVTLGLPSATALDTITVNEEGDNSVEV